MKLLILSFIIFFVSCGTYKNKPSELESKNNAEDNTENKSELSKNKPLNKESSENSQLESPDVLSGICSQYINACVSNQECADKYTKCLKPKSGEPTLVKTTLCSHATLPHVTFIVNEWSHSPGTNYLLCTYLQNNSLYLFAVNVKTSCQEKVLQEQNIYKTKGYTCAPQQAPPQNLQQQAD